VLRMNLKAEKAIEKTQEINEIHKLSLAVFQYDYPKFEKYNVKFVKISSKNK
jgi:hypothetical protein